MSTNEPEARSQPLLHALVEKMPSPMSFLQTASAKSGATLGTPSSSSHDNDMQLLLVEDEKKTLSYSLAMDVAYSLASSSSSMQCRGCGFSENNSCRCCKVAMLVTRRKEITNNQNQGQHQQQQQHHCKNKNENDAPFPLWCYQEGTNSNNDSNSRDEKDQSAALNQIHIKYVNSIADVIRYLVYAPSLPKHLIPQEGIVLLGLGDLISREHSAGIMELTHVLSILSDTGCVLETLRSEEVMADAHDDSSSNNITHSTALVATLNQQIYSSLPQTVYKQLGFSIASVQVQTAPNSTSSSCELVFEDLTSRNSFSFTHNDDEDIAWSV